MKENPRSERILLIGHGSREGEGIAEFLRFAADVQAAYREHTVKPCFLEFARPGILEAVDQAVADNSAGIILMPLFLFAARHMKQDIAGALERAQTRYPHLPFYAAKHLDVDDRLMALLDERIAEAEAAALEPRASKTAVLLVGRGSRNPEGNAGVYRVAERLRAERANAWVEVCFAGMAHPTVTEGIRHCIDQGAERVVILPYLLFAGVLTKRIAAAAQSVQAQWPAVEIRLAGHLGGHRRVLDVVCDRIDEALSLKEEAEYV